MLEEDLKEISNLLASILVFETKFKEEILTKTKNMSDVKIKELKSILLSVSLWQKEIIERKVKQDPNFYSKMLVARKKNDQEIMELYKQKFNNEDRKKMEVILNKMKNI